VAKVVVIGDVGGHPDQLRAALTAVGSRPGDGQLPPEVIVIQVGDLVDRGPDSAGVLAIVAGYLDRQPTQWVQLAGNHESQHLLGGVRFWPEPISEDSADTLRLWWDTGRMNVAAAVRTADGREALISHAGLTPANWRALGEPFTAAGAAAHLNRRPEPMIWQGSGLDDGEPGPLWADAGWELYEPWMRYYAGGGFVPFDQIHGHSSVVSYRDRSWHSPGRVRERASVDWDRRHTRVRIGGRAFIGIDPRHGRSGAPRWEPLVLDDADVLAGVAR
jgi:hypothetical protein